MIHKVLYTPLFWSYKFYLSSIIIKHTRLKFIVIHFEGITMYLMLFFHA